MYYSDKIEDEYCSSEPSCISASVNRLGDSKYVQHRVFKSPDGSDFHSYQSWLVYENSKIFVSEDNPFSDTVIDDLEAVARMIVDSELGEA